MDIYIKEGWGKARKTAGEDDLDLPFPFVPPSIEGMLRTLYYWDTYFTNVGLIADGHTDWAKENTDNLLFALNHFGCVPNYTRKDGADFCSQPPLLCLMIKDVYEQTKDDKWLKTAVCGLEKEYKFWMTERITPIGLNQYGCNAKDKKTLLAYYDYVATRIEMDKSLSDEVKMEIARNFVAEAESGEDYTPRYENHNALDYVQIGLNSHLYGVEDFLCEYFKDKDCEKYSLYKERKENRIKLIEKYCFDDKKGVYFDYNFVKGEKSKIICSACFLPYFYGYARKDGNLKLVFDTLKGEGGVSACQQAGDGSYQWGYPYVWAPYQFFAYNGLVKYGYLKEAEDLRLSYINLLTSVYNRTGALWERYDFFGEAKDLEYPTQKMLGWTAGTYRYFKNKEKKDD